MDTVGVGENLSATVRPSEADVLKRIEARKAARARKDFAEADRIRKELEAAGVLLEDGKAGTTWKYRE